MRCDIHVHSYYSGFVNQPVLRHLGRESYSQPEEIYETAKGRGMDLVTISDHDTIEGALQLAGRPDFFVSEEVTCTVEPPGAGPSRILHLGVLGISEAQHEGITARRTDAERLMSYLDEERIAWCVNHLFSPMTGPRESVDVDFALNRAPALEIRNSMMPAATNGFAAREAKKRGLGEVGGSDAHAIPSIARAYTVVEGAGTRAEFLEGIRAGRARAEGGNGSAALVTRDVVTNFARGYIYTFRNAHRSRENALRALGLVGLLPVLPLLPVIVALVHRGEIRKGRQIYSDFVDAAAMARELELQIGERGGGLPALD
jgi:predicted metal-dependent phosphoesterase TrpH